MIDSIVREVGSWVLFAKEFHGTSLSMFLSDWSLALSWSVLQVRKVYSEWVLPLEDCLKLNFDGASKGNPRPAGFGCVIRDHSSII